MDDLELRRPGARARPAQPYAFWAAFAALLALAGVLMLHRLGTAEICSSNEAIDGVSVQQMVEQREPWFPPQKNATALYTDLTRFRGRCWGTIQEEVPKPPLFSWSAVALDRAAGFSRVTAFNLRLVSAFYALAGLIVTMLFARSRLGSAGGLLAGAVLLASHQYVNQGRFGRVDMTLAFFEGLSLFTFLWWFSQDPGRRAAERAARWLLVLTMALAVLAKGPLGALLPGLAMGLFLLGAPARRRRLWTLLRPVALLFGLAVASSWHLACLVGQRHSFLNQQIGSENFGRFFGGLGRMPVWYYVEPILFGSGPLSLVALGAVVAALWPARDAGQSGVGAPARGSLASEMRFLAIFWLVTVVFFSLAAYKRNSYLLPLWPAMAVLAAWWTTRVLAPRYGRRAVVGVAGLCAVLWVFNFFYEPYSAARECGGPSFRRPAEEINRVVAPNAPLFTYDITLPEALRFYLDRDTPALAAPPGRLPAQAGGASGYMLTSARLLAAHPGLLKARPVLTIANGNDPLVLMAIGSGAGPAVGAMPAPPLPSAGGRPGPATGGSSASSAR
jgi:4-amino-4-deoxy-L-arabinose transferase-like glycosyltransferase